MKKLHIISSIAVIMLLTSCRNFMYSHNANSVADGKVFRVGTPEINLTYVHGTLVTTVARENSETVVETNNGDTVTNPTGSFRGLTTARFRTGPQVTGYLKDIAKKDAETAKEYIKAMPKLNKAQWDTKQQNPTEPVSLKSEPLSTVAEKIKSVAEPFTCPTGNCEFTELWKDNRIIYQTAVANKLLTYADDVSGWEGETGTFKHSLQSFLTRMAQLTAKGRTVTQMRIKYAKIQDGKLVDLNYVMIEPDGNQFDTHCPECVLLEE